MRRKLTSSLLALTGAATLFMSVGATAHAGPIVDLGSGAVELPIPDIGGIVSGSAGGVLNSVAPLLGSADAPGTVPGFPSVPLPAAPPADDRVVGGWYGTWTVSDGTYPAVLNISQANPLRANIDIPGRPCNADWTEESRSGAVVVVRATVRSGSCSSNTWLMTLTENSIYATDAQGYTASVEFRRG